MSSRSLVSRGTARSQLAGPRSAASLKHACLAARPDLPPPPAAALPCSRLADAPDALRSWPCVARPPGAPHPWPQRNEPERARGYHTRTLVHARTVPMSTRTGRHAPMHSCAHRPLHCHWHPHRQSCADGGTRSRAGRCTGNEKDLARDARVDAKRRRLPAEGRRASRLVRPLRAATQARRCCRPRCCRRGPGSEAWPGSGLSALDAGRWRIAPARSGASSERAVARSIFPLSALLAVVGHHQCSCLRRPPPLHIYARAIIVVCL